MKNRIEWLTTFRYVVPSDFEEFMEKMALQGWNVDKIGQWSSIKMDFHQSSPQKYRYVFDVNTHPNHQYKIMYQDFGWEFVGQMASCFIWRKKYNDIRPESFTDNASLEKRNRGVRNAVLVSTIMFSVILLVLLGVLIFAGNSLNQSDLLQMMIGILLSGLFSAYLWWVVWKIQRNIHR